MNNDRLYLSVKNKICQLIYEGIYKEGENIPAERTLAEDLNVSRVTVRKSLDLLEEDGIVERVQGSGTVVRLKETGYEGDMDIIALLAPAAKPFFSSFIDSFQRNAEKNDSLVLFKQNPKDQRVEDSLFKLYQKNIRNVVLWLEDLKVDIEHIKRLRGLGMNMVFFDIAVPSPYADCVFIDNNHAIATLYNFLKGKGTGEIGYVGWDNPLLSSVCERESTFNKLSSRSDNVFRIPWEEKNHLLSSTAELAYEFKSGRRSQDGIICGDGEIGIALKKAFLSIGLEDVAIVSVDDFPEAKNLALSTYKQCFESLAAKVYECLSKQNMKAYEWKAAFYPVEGKLIER